MPGDTQTVAHSIWIRERMNLAADALRQGGHLRLCVHGESMLPSLWPGDFVEIEACSLSDIRAGEIVLAMRGHRFFLHRVDGPESMNGFVLRGDSMPACDPIFPPEALIGRMVAPAAPTSWVAAKCSRAIGWALCYCRPARSLALKIRFRAKSPGGLLRSPQAEAEVSPSELRA
jgi:hypothetical protein